MKDGCPFCDYDGPSPIRQDFGEVIAFAPINPVAPGHTLIVPKRHVEDAYENFALTGLVFECAARFAAEWTVESNLITSVGPAATQAVKHLHVHVVPRREGDGLSLPWMGQKEAR